MKEVARALQDWQRREGRAEGLAEGRIEGRAEERAEGFQKTLEYLKSIGVSPENMEKFRAMYPDIKPEN